MYIPAPLHSPGSRASRSQHRPPRAPQATGLAPGRAARRQPAPDPARARTHSLTRAGFYLKCAKITKFCLILGHITVYGSPAFWIAALGRRSIMLKIFFFANFQPRGHPYQAWRALRKAGSRPVRQGPRSADPWPSIPSWLWTGRQPASTDRRVTGRLKPRVNPKPKYL